MTPAFHHGAVVRRGLGTGALLVLAACGGAGEEAQAPVQRETPAESILRIGRVWESRTVEKAFRTPPSKVAVVETALLSRVTLDADGKSAREELTAEEHYVMRDGLEYTCQAQGQVALTVRYRTHEGDPALELTRGNVTLNRRCNPVDPPGQKLRGLERTARFVLRADQLTPYDPPRETRVYVPVGD